MRLQELVPSEAMTAVGQHGQTKNDAADAAIAPVVVGATAAGMTFAAEVAVTAAVAAVAKWELVATSVVLRAAAVAMLVATGSGKAFAEAASVEQVLPSSNLMY